MKSVAGPPKLGVLTGVLEFTGGHCRSFWVLTVLAAALFALEMTAATWLQRKKLGKKYVLGYELDIAYLGGAIVLALVGAGSICVDALYRRRSVLQNNVRAEFNAFRGLKDGLGQLLLWDCSAK